jgi:hypothetical protein
VQALTRRNVSVIALCGLPVAAFLASCGANAAMIDAQALADAQGLSSATQALIAAINQYAPNAIKPAVQAEVTTLEASIIASIQSLSTATPAPTGATTLQSVDTALNTVLGAIGAALTTAAPMFPVLLPFVPMYDAAVALLPALEAYVNSVISPAVAAAPQNRAKAIKAHFTPDQARATLGIHKSK